MRGPKPAELTLSGAERKELEALVRRHNTPQQVALRGRMILAADDGKRNGQIGVIMIGMLASGCSKG
jgi:putative transposase